MPYWSLYLEGQGFSYLQIATLMATIQLTKIVAPSVWGWLGDRTGQRVRLVRFGAITGSLFFCRGVPGARVLRAASGDAGVHLFLERDSAPV
ncbi:MFS transporter [Marinobacter metalliresistant]|uniref:MFS transporter n=1 Tax=Marinobacter metalliresistant TaxID=2961995 RepID=A0ABZ2W838_9GAMM